MMYCPFCGQQNNEHAGQCANCGQSLQYYVGTQQPAHNPQPYIPSRLPQAILVTLFCCQPFGIVAIVYAALGASKAASCDYIGAMECNRNAENWCWLAFWLGLIPTALYAIALVSAIVSS